MYIDLYVYNDKNICMYIYVEYLKGKYIYIFIDLYYDIYIYMYIYICIEYWFLKKLDFFFCFFILYVVEKFCEGFKFK